MTRSNMQKAKKLFLEQWDPIGIAGEKGAEGEYDAYIDHALSIIQNSTSSEDLYEYLWWLETEHMGLEGNVEKTKAFAEDLFKEIKKTD